MSPRLKAVIYAVAALVCFGSGYILYRSEAYGMGPVVVQVLLGAAWTAGASAAWRRGGGDGGGGV